MTLENTHDQKMAALERHKQGHINYWKSNGNRPTDPKRFEDGFIQGWCDAENPSYPDIGRDSMLRQRQDEHIRANGSSSCEWAFVDGYHEGFDSRCGLDKQSFDTHQEKVKELERHKCVFMSLLRRDLILISRLGRATSGTGNNMEIAKRTLGVSRTDLFKAGVMQRTIAGLASAETHSWSTGKMKMLKSVDRAIVCGLFVMGMYNGGPLA